MRFEYRAADQACVFVRLEVRCTDNHRARVEGRGDGADTLRQLLDKEVGPAWIVRRQFVDLLLRFFVFKPVRAGQRHRVRLDVFSDDKLHAREADSVAGQGAKAECLLGATQVNHHFCFWLRHFIQFGCCHLEWNFAGIDPTHIALGAGQRHGCTIGESVFLADTDHRGDTKFPRHYGRVAGAPAALSDQRGGTPHGGPPIGAGALGE